MDAVIDHQILRNTLLFNDADEAILMEVASSAQPTRLNAGETLMRQDDPADTMYILQSGQVHIVRQYADGDEVILATEGPYYVIGELSLLANQPRTGTVVAVSDCEMLRLDRQFILEYCQQKPRVAVNALTALGHRLYRLTLRVRESAVGNIEARLASTLLLISGDEAGAAPVTVHETRLARATATEPAHVRQILRQWSSQGIIDYERNRLTINDPDTLRKLAG